MSLPKMVGSDGKTPAIVYRDGAPLLGLEELYKASKHAEGEEPVLVEVIIPPDFMSKENKRVKARQLWGDTLYTPDSDIVAVLMHMGYYAHYLAHPPALVSGFHAVLQLLPPQEKYPSKSRFVKSRAWSSGGGAGGEGCSLKVERAWLVTRSGTTIELQPCVDEVPAPYPTIQPGGNERQITTRTTGAKSSKVSQEVPVQFNLVNEPWLKYTLPAIADKGLKPSQWTSSRLLDEVLFLESNTLRYQLSFSEVVESDGGVRKALYTFSLCKTPLPVALMHKQGVPLPSSMLTTLAEGVEWEEFKWGVTTLHLRDQEYLLKRMHFMPTAKPTEDLMET